jgi:hypothetical protein
MEQIMNTLTMKNFMAWQSRIAKKYTTHSGAKNKNEIDMFAFTCIIKYSAMFRNYYNSHVSQFA